MQAFRFFVVALITVGSVGCQSRTGPASDACWQPLLVTHARIFPAPGRAAELQGGTIQGSNDSATNAFVTLATITAAPGDGEWIDVPVTTSTVYRWVKYYGPPGNTGAVAEVQFFSGTVALAGTDFGTPGTPGHLHGAAFDGDTGTYYDGTQDGSNYVGIDTAGGHLVATPQLSPHGGVYASARDVVITSSTAGATIRYSTDGTDPANGTIYAGPVHLTTGTTTIRAVATKTCLANSDVVAATYNIGAGPTGTQAFIGVGNSLTDTIDGYIAPISTTGGIDIEWSRYTVPGIGTWIYEQQPTGGFGVSNVQTALETIPHQHISFQPFPNMPCVPTGHASESTAQNRSDAVNIDVAWDDAVAANPNVQMWIYEAWPPTPTEGFRNCITGGGWTRDPSIWNPSSPATWEIAEQHELEYMEAVRTGLIALEPSRPVPYIVPAGRALRLLKAAVEAGNVPGIGSAAFFSTFFTNGGTDNHVTSFGRYFVGLVFHSCLFQADPRTLPDTNLGTSATVTAEQAAAFQQIVYDAVSGYALSGFAR